MSATEHDVIVVGGGPAGSCGGAVDRREVPDPGARPHPAGPADEEGSGRHHDPRLQAQRHHHAVRCAERAGRHRHGQEHAASPASGIHPLPQRARSRHPGRQARPRDPRQLRRPQDARGPSLARPTSALDVPKGPVQEIENCPESSSGPTSSLPETERCPDQSPEAEQASASVALQASDTVSPGSTKVLDEFNTTFGGTATRTSRSSSITPPGPVQVSTYCESA